MEDAPKNARSGLTDAEAAEMLAKLTTHFNEPVKPLSKFCTAVRTWFAAIERNNEDPSMLETMHGKNEPEEQFGQSYFKFLRRINIDISKSYLLARLLYSDEPLREQKCPIHKGHWDGQAQIFKGCTYGCDGSGWLKTPEMVKERLERYRSHFKKTDEAAIEFVKSTTPPEDISQEYVNYREHCEWVTLLGKGDIVPEAVRG